MAEYVHDFENLASLLLSSARVPVTEETGFASCSPLKLKRGEQTERLTHL
jgi:hypothetical protein